MKKMALGLGAIFLIFMLAVSALIVAVFTQQAAQNTDGIVLENLVFEGEELNDKVTIEMSGDAEATLTGKMSEDRKSFTVSWDGESGDGEITAGEASAIGQKAVNIAKSHEGENITYDAGGTSWKRLDCGGLVHLAYKGAGIKVPAKTDKLKKIGKSIGKDFSKAKVGDIIVYVDTRNPKGSRWRHVALYYGNGKKIEMVRKGIRIASVKNTNIFKLESIRRITNDSSFNTDVIYSALPPQNKGGNLFDLVYADSLEKNAEKVWRGLKNIGCSDEAAAGIMGNIAGESSFDPAYLEPGGCGKGGYYHQHDFGLFNMNCGRAESMVNYAKKSGKSWTNIDAQLEWLDKKDVAKQFRSYTGKHHTYPNGTVTWWGIKMTWKDFKGINPSNYTKYIDKELKGKPGNGNGDKNAVELATHIFCNVFERAGIPHLEKNRKTAAKKWYQKFSGKYPTGAGGGFDEMEFTGTIDGEKLTLTGNIDEHQIEAEGYFRKWSREETHKNVKTHNEIYAQGGEDGGSNGGQTFSGNIEKLVYVQWKEPYASKPYASYNTMRRTACGCFSTTHAIVVLTGKKITPIDVATKMRSKMGDSFYCPGAGTYHGVLGTVAGWYGLKAKYGCKSVKSVKKALNQGKCVVAAAGGFVFVNPDGSLRASGGHYICFWKTDGKYVYAKDSSCEKGYACKYNDKQLAMFLACSGEQIVISK